MVKQNLDLKGFLKFVLQGGNDLQKTECINFCQAVKLTLSYTAYNLRNVRRIKINNNSKRMLK